MRLLPVLVGLGKHRERVVPRELTRRLKEIFKTVEGRILLFPGSGTGAWECCIVNTLSPGEKVLGCVNGHFSDLFCKTATAHGKFDTRLVDLASFNLPVYDEPAHPRLKTYSHAHTREWCASDNEADAFLFVMREYNYGPPPSVLDAMRYLVRVWQYKPMALVG